MNFPIDSDLLAHAHAALNQCNRLYWLIGGAGAGKTTICKMLAEWYDLPIYDMDAYIYGGYHPRFTQARHPTNTAWASAPDGLAWLLNHSWEAFNQFNQAALVEYLDLLAEDLAAIPPDAPLLIDGGVCNPQVLVRAIAPRQIVCLAGPDQSSEEIWTATEERLAMKTFIERLPDPEQAWRQFLTFDANITHTILAECDTNQITICARTNTDTVTTMADRVAAAFGFSVREMIG